jgi:hypothetical protein
MSPNKANWWRSLKWEVGSVKRTEPFASRGPRGPGAARSRQTKPIRRSPAGSRGQSCETNPIGPGGKGSGAARRWDRWYNKGNWPWSRGRAGRGRQETRGNRAGTPELRRNALRRHYDRADRPRVQNKANLVQSLPGGAGDGPTPSPWPPPACAGAGCGPVATIRPNKANFRGSLKLEVSSFKRKEPSGGGSESSTFELHTSNWRQGKPK